MLTVRTVGAALAALLAFATPPALAEAPITLPKLNLDTKQTTVSGVSSGAYMATQMHIAYSASIAGAGMIAGGPYGCVDNIRGADTIDVARQRCMQTTAGAPDLGRLLQTVQYRAAMKDIDSPDHLKNARVYLLSGGRDSVVTPPVVEAAANLYRALKVPAANIDVVRLPEAQHSFPTDGFGNACDVLGMPFLSNCHYDAAGALLKHLYPDARTPNAAEAKGRPVAFTQKPYIADPSRSGMLDYGYVYIPESCANGQRCRLHVAFHGCEMSAELIGDAFAAHAGYNRWADVNNLVVLYPQIKHSAKPTSNPKGCWDWFAYTGYDYNLKSGFQPTAVRKMIGALIK